MRRSRGVLEEATSEATMWTAWARVASGNRSAGIDGVTPAQFAVRLGSNVDSLRADLRGGCYQPTPYRLQTVRHAGKRRRVCIATVRDRLAQRALLEVLTDPVEQRLAEAAYAYRRGRSWLDALRRAEHQRRAGRTHVFRGDIKEFFASIPHQRMGRVLKEVVQDPRVGDLVQGWLTAARVDRSGRSHPVAGLPEGTSIAPLLANLYLSSFDATVEDLSGVYLRYADDLAIFCSSYEEVVAAQITVARGLSKLKLSLNDSKSYVSSFERGFCFLGWVFFEDGGYPVDGDSRHPFRMRAGR